MEIVQLTTPAEEQRYEAWVKTHPEGNFWQSLERRTYLIERGMDVRIYAVLKEEKIQASALVVIDRSRAGSVWEIPRGPLWNEELKMENGEFLLRKIHDDAKSDGCLALFLSPFNPILHSPFSILNSGRHIHAEATRIIDLTQSEEAILAQMHPKGRYNIKVAQKNGIVVRRSDDVGAFHALLTATAARDAFKGHSKAHYEAFLKHIPGVFLLMAYTAESEPVAGMMGVIWPTSGQQISGESNNTIAGDPLSTAALSTVHSNGIYYYGASSYAHRNLMAPYLLQWEAMMLCKANGCAFYDLLGIEPMKTLDIGHETLESKSKVSNLKSHPWAGISDFKAKFGGTVVTYPPEQVIVLQPMKWRLLQMKRKLIG